MAIASPPLPLHLVSHKPDSAFPSWTSRIRCVWGSPAPGVGPRTRRRSCRARVSSVSRSSPVVFRDLDADDFRHPLDKQNTLLLRAIPGLDEIVKALLGPVAEQVMLLQNIGTSVLVSENQVDCIILFPYYFLEFGKWLHSHHPSSQRMRTFYQMS